MWDDFFLPGDLMVNKGKDGQPNGCMSLSAALAPFMTMLSPDLISAYVHRYILQGTTGMYRSKAIDV